MSIGNGINGNVFGGDEVGAMVIDIGSSSIKLGHAGEDFPRVDFPSYYQIYEKSIETEDSQYKSRKYNFGDDKLSIIGPNKEIEPFVKNGIVCDWEIFELFLDFNFKNQLMVNPIEHPFLFTDPIDSTQKDKDKLMEIAFEKFNMPAFSIAKSPALSAFSNGKTTALVVDIGFSKSVVCPVLDGYCLMQSCQTTEISSGFLSQITENYLKSLEGMDLTPALLTSLKKKNQLEIQMPSESWFKFHRLKLLSEFQQSTYEILEKRYSENGNFKSVEFEFPSGLTKSFTAIRHLIPEVYFVEPHATLEKYLPEMTKNRHELLPQLIMKSANSCDIDIRGNILNNILSCGGGSMINGFSDRLHNEMVLIAQPNVKVRVVSPLNNTEKRFSAWLGGSILASLGSFQQLWISTFDYQESGTRSLMTKLVT